MIEILSLEKDVLNKKIKYNRLILVYLYKKINQHLIKIGKKDIKKDKRRTILFKALKDYEDRLPAGILEKLKECIGFYLT